MWLEDDAYPDGQRLPMTPDEQATVDADVVDELAAALEGVTIPGVDVDLADELGRAARMLRLGLD